VVVLVLDEFGRGCWAGPLVVGAVILDRDISGLKDSKLMSPSHRLKMSAIIYSSARAFGLGWVQSQDIDDLGLTAATQLGIQRAIQGIQCAYDCIIIDGNINYLLNYDHRARAVVRADQNIPSVSAASVVAKVARDEWMHSAALDFPQYGFEHHVGYGTKLHIEKLRQHGPCRLHRLSFKPIQGFTPIHSV